MSTSAKNNATPAIVELADQLMADIRKRRLSIGDSYLSAAEAARMLRISTGTANRALQLLEQRRVLLRRQRKGSILIAAQNKPLPGTVGRVNLILAQNFLRSEGLLADGVLLGIQGVLPSAEFQFQFMPITDEADAITRVISDALRAKQTEAFVIVRASLGVQRAIAGSGLPAVLHGTPYPSIRGLAWIDRDNRQTGALLTDYLLAQGYRRMLLLMRQQMMPGDHLILDSVVERLAAAGLGPDALTIRCLPTDEEVVREEVAGVIKQSSEPLGILCRSVPLAEAAEAAVSRRSGKSRARGSRPAAIVVSDVYRRANDIPRWPCARMTLTPEEIGERIGQSLLAQIDRKKAHPQQSFIPVSLRLPPG